MTCTSSCHLDFQLATDCSYKKVATLLPANYLGVQNMLLSMQSALLHMIDKWEASDQGDGGCLNDPDTLKVVGVVCPTKPSKHWVMVLTS